MKKKTVVMILAVTATAFAASARAETAVCTVKAPEICLRESPSTKAHIVTVLKQDARVTTSGACAGGWVKVVTEDGRRAGYVGGWAISEAAPKAAAAAVATAAKSEAARVKSDATDTAPKNVPSNERLAIQVTELRLNVLSIERDMEGMGKDIHKIEATLRRKATLKKVAAHNKKVRRQLALR